MPQFNRPTTTCGSRRTWRVATRAEELARLAGALEAAAAGEAEAVSGLTEALRHVERVLALWDEVPDAEELTGVAPPSVLARATELAGHSSEGALAVSEARRLYPSVIVLESLAISQTPPLDAAGIAELLRENLARGLRDLREALEA